MPLIKDSAIVLKRLDFAESSQVLAIFTRTHGKVRIIAKGIRRSTKTRFSPGIDLLESGEAVLSVRHIGQEALATLSEWKQALTFGGLRERLERLNAAQYAADVVVSLTEDWDAHPGLYDAMVELLRTLCECEAALPLLVSFQRTLLDEIGLMPRLDGCVGCGRSFESARDLYFSSFEGGLLCRDCEPARAEKRLVRISREGLRGGVFKTPSDVAGAFDLFDYHLTHLMGREPAAHGPLAFAARKFGGAGR